MVLTTPPIAAQTIPTPRRTNPPLLRGNLCRSLYRPLCRGRLARFGSLASKVAQVAEPAVSQAASLHRIPATLGVSRLILGAPERSTLLNFARNIIRHVSPLLPDKIHLLVYA